jgi:hypothetical protein
VGASSKTRDLLNELRDAGHVAELVDAYRLSIAVACAFGREPRINGSGEQRTTMFAANTLDTPDLALRTAIAEMYPAARLTPYRTAEDLAEQGAEILRTYMEGDNIRFSEVMKKVEEATKSLTNGDGAKAEEPG